MAILARDAGHQVLKRTRCDGKADDQNAGSFDLEVDGVAFAQIRFLHDRFRDANSERVSPLRYGGVGCGSRIAVHAWSIYE